MLVPLLTAMEGSRQWSTENCADEAGQDHTNLQMPGDRNNYLAILRAIGPQVESQGTFA